MDHRYKHGHAPAGNKTKEYRAYRGMYERCYNPNDKSYKRYGGRGIDLRLTFEEFIDEVGLAPSANHSIDRINNNGHYEKGNIRWATPQEQANNTRQNKLLTYKGKTKTMADWARDKGISYKALHWRMQNGWTVTKALNTPEKEKLMIEYRGKTQTIDQWAKETGIHRQTIRGRMYRGWPIDKWFLKENPSNKSYKK